MSVPAPSMSLRHARAVVAIPTHRPSPVRCQAVDPAVRTVVDSVRAMVAAGRLDAFNVMQVIHATAKAGTSWDAVQDAVAELAKGADGVAGTADDVIPIGTLNTLRNLMHSGVLADVVAWAKSAGIKVNSSGPGSVRAAICACWPR